LNISSLSYPIIGDPIQGKINIQPQKSWQTKNRRLIVQRLATRTNATAKGTAQEATTRQKTISAVLDPVKIDNTNFTNN
jgi:hypothetical protein